MFDVLGRESKCNGELKKRSTRGPICGVFIATCPLLFENYWIVIGLLFGCWTGTRQYKEIIEQRLFVPRALGIFWNIWRKI